MTIKLLGAFLILAVCGGFGCSLSARCRQEEAMLSSLLHILQYMEYELQYRLTPLPELLRHAAQETRPPLRGVLLSLVHELEQQSAPDAAGCMRAILRRTEDIPGKVKRILHQLSRSLGRLELSCQIRELQGLQETCKAELTLLRSGKELRLRNYQTLSLCAGVALIILFI